MRQVVNVGLCKINTVTFYNAILFRRDELNLSTYSIMGEKRIGKYVIIYMNKHDQNRSLKNV